MLLSICNTPDILKVMKIVKLSLTIIKIFVPIILIVSIMIDYTRVIVSKDSDALFNMSKLTIKRIIAACLIFLIPSLIGIIFNVTSTTKSYKACFDNANDEYISSLYEIQLKKLLTEAKEVDNPTYLSTARRYLENITDESKRNNYEEQINLLEDGYITKK